MGPKIVDPHNSGSVVRFFFLILDNEKGQQVDESNNKGLCQKNVVQDKWAILGPEMAHLHNSETFKKFCRMKGANRYMKILLVVFREKNSFEAI